MQNPPPTWVTNKEHLSKVSDLSDPVFEYVLAIMPIGAKKLTKAQRAERAEKVVSVLRSFSSYTGEFADGSWYNCFLSSIFP